MTVSSVMQSGPDPEQMVHDSSTRYSLRLPTRSTANRGTATRNRAAAQAVRRGVVNPGRRREENTSTPMSIGGIGGALIDGGHWHRRLAL